MIPEPHDVKMDDRAVAEQEHQSRLPGIRVRPLSKEGCPHRYGMRDWVDSCDINEGRPCIFETFEAEQGCEIFRYILREIEAEMGI
ncbi:MAG: hypothetical protein Q7O66_08000 [Dehalococcoidia bacterium]|nr:hypothetical protein [Dehalococcoidia bacterium]